MNVPAKGSPAPDFALPASPGDDPVRLSSHRGEPVIVFFVPLAFTDTCTEEFCHLGENWEKWGRTRRNDLRGQHRLPLC